MRAGAVPWPDELAAQYVQVGYWREQPLGSLPWKWADQYGPRPAIIDGDVRISYRELAEATEVLAERLARRGLGPGDNVLVQLPNCWEFVLLLFACLRLGVAPLLALMPFGSHELAQLARLARVRAIAGPMSWKGVSRRELLSEVARGCTPEPGVILLGSEAGEQALDIRPLVGRGTGRQAWLDRVSPDPGDVALFLLSGGSTGTPKIISRTHNDYEYNARCSAEVCGFGPDTVYLAILPVSHNFVLGSPGILGTLMAGGKVVLAPSPSPERAWWLIEQENVTVTSAVPAIVQRWVQTAKLADRRRLASLRVLQVGGSVFPPDLAAMVTPALGCAVQQVYGMAEGLLNYTRLDDPEQVVLTTQGRPVSPADEIKIVSEAGEPVPPGTPGELLTRGPYTPRGYFAAPEYNRQAFAGGWYRTGDIVRQDSAGNLIVEGRCKDLINSGGEKISAREVEDLMRRLPQVADVAAIPLPSRSLGETVGVYVVLRPGATLTLDEVRREFGHVGAAAFKTPQHLEVMPVLPSTAIGKIDKPALRRHAAAALREGTR